MEKGKIERALLFSQEMVLAYLADRKFVTRRIPGPTNSFVNGKRVSPKKWNAWEFDLPNYELKDGAFWFFSGSTQEWYKVEPIYNPKDLLWFRERWNYILDDKGEPMGFYHSTDTDLCSKWRPSIHQPKEACRLWGEVTVCNCERLIDITEEQAVKEGIQWYHDERMGFRYKDYIADASGYGHPEHDYPTVFNPVTSFGTLWEYIHGEGSWVANPPVYAINFNPLSKTGRPDTATLPSDPGAWKREQG